MKHFLTAIVLSWSLLLPGCGPDQPTSQPAGDKTDPGSTADKKEPGSTSEKLTLRYRFQPGQRMEFLDKTSVKNNLLSLGQKTTTQYSFYFHIVIHSVDGDGNAKGTWINDRVIYKVQGPGGTLAYDSQDGKEPENPQWALVKGQIMFMEHAEANFVVSSRGQVSDLQPTEKLKKQLKETGQEANSKMLDNLLRSIGNGLFVILPDEPVGPEDTWVDHEVDNVVTVEVTQEITYTLTGEVEKEGNKMLEIRESTDASTKLLPGSPYQKFGYKKGSVNGMNWFDPELGWHREKSNNAVQETTVAQGDLVIVSESDTQQSIQLLAVKTEPEEKSDAKKKADDEAAKKKADAKK